MSVEDDGRGIDKGKLAAMVVAHGLVEPKQAATLTCNELIQLLFQSSTTPANTGQGEPCRDAGLWVVRNCLQRLQGKFEMLSRPNQGTRVTLKIPHRS